MSVTATAEPSKDVKRDDLYWGDICTLPRQYRITTEDIDIGGFCGLSSGITPQSLSDASNLSGKTGIKARKGVTYLKDFIIALMRYDDELWARGHKGQKRWQNDIIASASDSNAPHVMPNYWVRMVDEYFDDLLPHLRFWDIPSAEAQIAKKKPFDNGRTIDALKKSESRQHALEYVREWRETYLKSGKAPTDTKTPTKITIGYLNSLKRAELMSFCKTNSIDIAGIAPKHGIEPGNLMKITREDYVTIIADSYGLLNQFEQQTEIEPTSEE